MADAYDHRAIEARWQAAWDKDDAFSSGMDSSRPKYYVLEMFPYPSGRIHMGHVRNYAIGDVLSRFQRMRGFNVLHPMGWDSFGLPAENAAIQHGVHPAKWTRENIANMRRQLKGLGLSYDWGREVSTFLPEYYRWNQWIFLKLYEKGLAYRKRSSVNWCPSCATVLANEQVEGGLCWRCDSPVVTRDLEQWFLKITQYADELLEYTHRLPGWPERVLVMQRNWIGRSEGVEAVFRVEGPGEAIKVFTTRPDTIYGVTFLSLAAGHTGVQRVTTAERLKEVEAFVLRVKSEARLRRETEPVDKEGVFTGAYCTNPLTGGRVPVYVANFVLMEYGTGAVMGVPAHDQRDFEFARRHGLPIRAVINPLGAPLDPAAMDYAYTADGVMADSGPFSGMRNTDAMRPIVDLLVEKGVGRRSITYRLRDWGVSRQRYWGSPIPVVYCARCGCVPVPYKDLPVVLPEDVRLTGTGESPLAASKAFVETECPACSGKARRETDTMDTFVDSSWYFLRYASPGEGGLPFDAGEAAYWMPVDRYVGGIEHAVMHLLYARFFTKALRDMGLVRFDEPFMNLITQGMVCKETVRCPEHGFLLPEESEGGACLRCGSTVVLGAIEKMSKSKKNTVDPDGIIARYGADTTRLFSLFAAPPEKDLEWSEEGVEGSYRFLNRVWRLVTENPALLDGITPYDPATDGPLEGPERELRRAAHGAVKKVTEDIGQRFHFNTAISSIMELVNALYLYLPGLGAGKGRGGAKAVKVFRESVEAVVLLLSPFAPHMAEELWQRLGKSPRLYRCPWPAFDAGALAREDADIVVQVNGRLRGRIIVPADAPEETVRAIAMGDEKVAPWIGGKAIKKFVYVPGKLVNMVVE
jgi:leucyl-tRNA synthetase